MKDNKIQYTDLTNIQFDFVPRIMMNRRSARKIADSASRTQRQMITSKQALLASSSQLKQLLGHKLDNIKKSKSKYLKSRLRIPVLKTSSIEDGETTLETKPLQDADKLGPLDINIASKFNNLQRYSQKIVGQTSLPKPDHTKVKEEKTLRIKVEISSPKNGVLRASESRKVGRVMGLSETQTNCLRRRVQNHKGNSGVMSTSLGIEQKKGRSGYYISDIKTSVSEFKNNEEFMDAHLTHFMESVDTFKLFSCSYLPLKPHKTVQLPPPTHPLTLVFDLDETLIHAKILDWDTPKEELAWGHTVNIQTEECKYQVNLKIRPHAREVLQRLSQKFEIGALTASQQHYGSRLLNELDPEGKIFSFKLYRPHCLEMHSRVSHVKDLRVLGNRDLSKVVLIDNSPHSYVFQKKNGIPIVSFICDQNDRQLLKLQQFLLSLQGTSNVQRALHEHFRLQDYNHYNCLSKLVEELY